MSWKTDCPNTRERTAMLKRCGKKCFLGTKKSFPICTKNTCTLNYRGVHAAYVRSRQYRKRGSKYRAISRKAVKLLTSV